MSGHTGAWDDRMRFQWQQVASKGIPPFGLPPFGLLCFTPFGLLCIFSINPIWSTVYSNGFIIATTIHYHHTLSCLSCIKKNTPQTQKKCYQILSEEATTLWSYWYNHSEPSHVCPIIIQLLKKALNSTKEMQYDIVIGSHYPLVLY